MRRALMAVLAVVGLALSVSGCLVVPVLSEPGVGTSPSTGDQSNGKVRSLGLLQEARLQVPDLPSGTTLAPDDLLPTMLKPSLTSSDPACAAVVLRTGPNFDVKQAELSLLLAPERDGLLGEWLRTVPSSETAGLVVTQWGTAAGSACTSVKVILAGDVGVDGTLAPGPALPGSPEARSARLTYSVDGSPITQTIVAATVTDVLIVLVFDSLPEEMIPQVTAKAIARARVALAQ